MTNKEILEGVKNLLFSSKKEEVETPVELNFVETKLKDGTNVVYDELKVGGKFLLKQDSETSIPAPKGDYLLPDGQTVTVNEDGIIASVGIIEVPAEDAPEDMPVDAPETIETPEDVVEEEDVVANLNERLLKIEQLLQEMGVKFSAIEEKFSKIENEPISAPVQFTATKEEKKEKNRIDAFKAFRK